MPWQNCWPGRRATPGWSSIAASSTTRPSLRKAPGPGTQPHLPVSFEANQGQADSQVRFLAHGTGYGLFLTPSETVLSLHRPSTPSNGLSVAPADAGGDVLRMQFVGANAAPPMVGRDPLPGV